MTITEFILARLAEKQKRATVTMSCNQVHPEYDTMCAVLHQQVDDQALRECEAMRQIVELHKSWPVLMERPPTFEPVDSATPDTFAMRASQQIAWTTEQQYRESFGSEPPTAPMTRALAAIWSDHEDYDEAWRA